MRLETALLAASLASLALAGCEDKSHAPASTAAPSASPSANAPLGIDPRLGAAVAAAASGTPPAGPAGQKGGPPESGVFAAGEADKIAPKGAPPKIEVVDAGSEPRVELAPSIDPAAKDQKAKLVVSVRTGIGGRDTVMPNVEYTLAFSGDKPKEKDGVDVTAKVTRAAAAANQPGALPKGLDDALAKLKGTRVRFHLEKGIATGFSVERAKDADKELEAAVRPLADAIELAIVPSPGKPVGAGATWLASDRANMLGVEVVRYRAYKVEKIDGDSVSLSVDTRQYAADEKTFDIGGMPPGVSAALEGFNSLGKGDARVTTKGLFPSAGQVREQMQVRLRVGQQRAMLQGELATAVGAP
jgi:hypothetical protein